MSFGKLFGAVVFGAALVSQAQAASVDCTKVAKPAPASQQIGPYLFKAGCQIKGTGAHTHSVSWPMIATPANAATQKWNALAQKTATTTFADQGADDFDQSNITCTIGTASDRLISVHFDFYANSAGAAHPTIAQTDM